MLDNIFEINVPAKASEWVFIHFSIQEDMEGTFTLFYSKSKTLEISL